MSEPILAKWHKCHNCGGPVSVMINKSNRAYYRCGTCLVKFEHHSTRESQKYLASIGATSEADPAPAPAPKPAPKKAAETTETPPPPPPKRGAGLLLD